MPQPLPVRHRCFNPRARVGRDLHSLPSPRMVASFNPRARVGRDDDCTKGHDAIHQFQSTRPRGARLSSDVRSPDQSAFQSTRPRGARPGAPCRVRSRRSSFNPRARVGRDSSSTTGIVSLDKFQSTRPRGARHAELIGSLAHAARVSIHAPAWGATADRLGCIRVENVSIHAPAWGATICQVAVQQRPCKFQSTRPRGARRPTCRRCRRRRRVSIHAPAWGATPLRPHVRTAACVSIHAPAWGAT